MVLSIKFLSKVRQSNACCGSHFDTRRKPCLLGPFAKVKTYSCVAFSKPNPLHDGSVFLQENIDFNRPLHVGAKSAPLKRPDRRSRSGRLRLRSLAPPPQIEPAALGFDLVGTGEPDVMGFGFDSPCQKEGQERFYLSCPSFWVPPPLAAPPYLFYLLGRNKSARHQDFCYAKMHDTPHSRRIFSPTSGLTLLAKKEALALPVLLFWVSPPLGGFTPSPITVPCPADYNQRA